MSVARNAPAALGMLVLGGCSLAPHYAPPKLTPLPVAYKEAGPWQIAHPADKLPRGTWWKAYDDPELGRLEAMVDDRNPTVAEAVASYDIARADVAQAQSALFPQVIGDASMTTNRQSERRPLRPSSFAFGWEQARLLDRCSGGRQDHNM